MTKTALRLSFILLWCVCSAEGQDNLGPVVGTITEDGQRSISMFEFGIEQLEEAKASSLQLQQWGLSCEYPSSRPDETHCSLRRTVIDRWGEVGEAAVDTIISEHQHDSYDDTLNLTHVDWQEGRLDFNVILTDRNTIEVTVLLSFDDKWIYLKDFKAIGVARGISSDTMSALEYRIPEYSYTLDVPVRMKGMRSEGQKNLEDMLQSLSQEDRMIWERSQEEGELGTLLDTVELEPKLRELFPDYDEIKAGERDLSPEEERRLEVLFFEEAKAFFGKQGFSAAGLQEVLDFMRTTVITPAR